LSIMDDLAVWPVVTSDFSAIREAVLLSKDAQISFWDALILIAAIFSGAASLYTEDLNHGQIIAGIKIVNPFFFSEESNPTL
ncbi:MAG: PIN domain-containing protein, partial [Gammaproteobacteria bacterium]|nr:PIN domain-containing protein [Gammaproteobacteria bacterium]